MYTIARAPPPNGFAAAPIYQLTATPANPSASAVAPAHQQAALPPVAAIAPHPPATEPAAAPIDPLAGTNYVTLRTLGRGSFGFVQLATDARSGELVAVKCLKRLGLNKYVEAEIMNHSRLRHPHVVQFNEVFLTRDYICIVMEFATGGSLFQYVLKQGKLKESVARWFFQQLIIGVDYCHKKGVANRDLKLENTLLQVVNGLPLPLLKICDFGYSKADQKSTAKSKVGTLTYMAPEVLINREGKYDGKVADIWSCGVMLYVMLLGRYPFDARSATATAKAAEVIQMLERMVGQKYLLPDNVDISPACQDLLRRMLIPDPSRRISMEDILRNPFFLHNLPPDAATMNDTYVGMKPPAHAQTPAQIRELLDAAVGGVAPHYRQPVMALPDETFDDIIAAAISEELKARRSKASPSLQTFIQQYKL